MTLAQTLEATDIKLNTVARELDSVLPPDIWYLPDEFTTDEIADRSNYRPYVESAILIRPQTVEQVQSAVRVAHRLHVPIVPRGAGTGLVGGAVSRQRNVSIVLSLERLDRIVWIHPVNQTIRVQAGVITDTVNKEAEEYGLFYAPDPASSAISTIGGNIVTDAGGYHCVKYGTTSGSILSLAVVLADGSLVETGGEVLKNAAGLDLTSLFVGSEGTLGIVVEAILRLRPRPKGNESLAVFVRDIADVGSVVEALSLSGVQPAICEMMAIPKVLRSSQTLKDHVEGNQWEVLIQVEGSGAREDIRILEQVLSRTSSDTVPLSSEDADWLLRLRTEGSDKPANHWHISSDAAVPLSNISAILQEVERIAHRHGYYYTVVAHIGDGNIHAGFYAPREPGNLTLPLGLIEAHRELTESALRLGGTVTGEHGVGLELAEYLPEQLGREHYALQRRIKQAVDPDNILNPGKWL